MDVSFNNVLEISRPYFMGVPKPAQTEGSGQPVWPAGAPLPEEGAPAQSGAPAPSSRPPSAAAAPPAPATTPVAAPPPRPPSEPIEPEPHIIHKATVMREAAEKRRELPEVDDEEEPAGTLSPPSHIIRKPPRTLPSPAPAPAAPCPSPARPPSTAPLPPQPMPEAQQEQSVQYRPPIHQVQAPSSRPPDPFASSRLPDPYSPSRPPEQYARYHYESTLPDGGRNSHSLVASSQPSVSPRHSPQQPQTYARMSSSISQHAASRLREGTLHSPPTHRYAMPPSQPPPPHNDRVPPIYHPQATSSSQRISSADVRSSQIYSPLQSRRETSPYARVASHYDRQPAVPSRKYDPQQAYPGYRPSPTAPQILSNHRIDTQQHLQYKHPTIDSMNAHYSGRVADRSVASLPSSPHDSVRLPPRVDYPSMSRSGDVRSGYYQTPSTSSSRFGTNVPVPPIPNSSLNPRTSYLSAAAAKTSYDYSTPNSVQNSPARSTTKSGYPNQQARMTVSVTSIVNQMNQSKQKRTSPVPAPAQVIQNKQKRESPLDLSVKTVKNSADSSTTQDDAVDSASMENKALSLQPRPSLISSRNSQIPTAGYASLKVDFAPNFIEYGDRSASHSYSSAAAAPGHPSVRYNGSVDTRRIPESYSVESPRHIYPERSKYSVPVARPEYIPKIDLTRSVNDQRHSDNRIRDDRNFVIDNRKRPTGPIVSNIPEKIIRYDAGIPENRIERLNQSAREQHELMSRPVYSYSAFQNEQKRAISSSIYRDMHASHRYPTNPYPGELPNREPPLNDYRTHYHDRNQPVNSRHHHIVQKIPGHRDVHPHHLETHSRIPANKNVLSILRNSLETKHTGHGDQVRTVKPDIIVIDDTDDPVIEITDLPKENDQGSCVKSVIKPFPTHTGPGLGHHIQMPKAVDSIPRDSDYQQNENIDLLRKSPEIDVASRIRTKAELKVMPPSQDNSVKTDTKQSSLPETDKERKPLPKSQKQHLFNQIREDLRLESVIKCEKPFEIPIPEVKTEPMNIEEIERDAEISIKSEIITDNFEPQSAETGTDMPEDLDWANACDNFMEQLKSGCHKKKGHKRRVDTVDIESDNKLDKLEKNDAELSILEKPLQTTEIKLNIPTDMIIKQEPVDEDETKNEDLPNPSIITDKILNEDLVNTPLVPEQKTNKEDASATLLPENKEKKTESRVEKLKNVKKTEGNRKNDGENKHDGNKRQDIDKLTKAKKAKVKSEKIIGSVCTIKKEPKERKQDKSKTLEGEKVNQIKTVIKEELESTDDDEPLIKSKIMKEKEQSEKNFKYKLLKDLSEKSAYVKLEFCDVDVNKNTRKSLDTTSKEKEDKPSKGKLFRQSSRSKVKLLSVDNNKHDKKEVDSSTDSDDDLCVASRLRMRKNTKTEDTNKTGSVAKTPVKSSPSKKLDSSSASNSSTPVRKAGFGDGSDFHPGWEEELYRYKRSLRMPTRLIAIPRGRSGGPFVRGSGAFFTRGTTSLPDLDPAPLSPAPSSAPSAATDDLYARRPDKLTLDSDLDSNSSCSAPTRLQYDSEASTSTIFSSSKTKNKGRSIVDVLIQKCGKKEDTKKKSKDRDDKTPKVISKSFNTTELLPTPSLGLVNNNNRGSLSAKKEKLLENISYLGAFRKETVATFRHTFINNTDGLIGATEEFAPVVLKTRTRTESRVLKHRATIREVFGDERPASAPPTSCRDEETADEKEEKIVIKKEPGTESKPKLIKSKKIAKDKLKRSSSIRDGLRSTKSLKRNDAKGRLMRLKKRNSIMKSLNSKRLKEISTNKHKSESNSNGEDKSKSKDENSSPLSVDGNVEVKKRFKRVFGRRKFSSGFDYIRKKKKIIRREEGCPKVRRPAIKPSPESVHDIHKEIKSWFINKSIGETHLHRAARLGYTDCVAYCLETMEADPSAKDNAGFTPLHVAAQKGHVRIARLLLQYGANVSAAAQGGIRPLHEACENCHVEVIRLLLSYGADPLLGTYAGQTPEELTEGPATKLLQLHIADVQGYAVEPWRFPPPCEIIDRDELGCDPLASPPPASPPPPPDAMIEIQCSDAPLPPFYSLRTAPGQPADGQWCLLQDITNFLQIKSKESLLKQIHCGSGSPKELLREIRTQEFLERAQCHQLLCAGEKVNVRASKVALVRVTDKLRQLLKMETALVS